MDTALFGRPHVGVNLFHPPCEDCHEEAGRGLCLEPVAIGSDGFQYHPGDPGVVVEWPACPWRWSALRRLGQDLVPLDRIIWWAHERGLHLDKHLSAGGSRLFRRWLERKDWLGILCRNRRDQEEKNKRNAKGWK